MTDQPDTQQSSLTHGLRTANPKPTPKWVWIIVILSALVILIFGGLLWRSQHQVAQLRDDLESKQNSTRIQEENKALVEKVGALIILPDDETPTIATVSDLDKLKNQPFFAKAELGDKVLIYAKAKKAYLYRPSKNKIIELAPLSGNGDIPTGNAPVTQVTPSNAPVTSTVNAP